LRLSFCAVNLYQPLGRVFLDEKAMNTSSKEEAILTAARRAAMAHGYAGLNFRELAAEVGIKAPTIYHYFPTKTTLGAAVAKRYWQDIVVALDEISTTSPDAITALRRYPEIFRNSLSSDNRMCLASFMTAEYDDLPEPVRNEVQAFADVNVAWLVKLLPAAGIVKAKDSHARAQAIYSAVAGAQLFARGRSDISLFDTMIDNYQTVGLLPA
jgi:TetR/AcrR family transcriptional regulator, transcriptional repressor for nem operon